MTLFGVSDYNTVAWQSIIYLSKVRLTRRRK
jgi:hypothetical protein